jgi:predicted ATPase
VVSTALKRRSGPGTRPPSLITLTGVGGVGKIRLALETAARLVGDFPEGVYVVELAAVANPAAIPEVAAELAEERLAASGLSDQVRDLHARFYAAMEQPVMELWDGPDQKQAYEWLDRELANLRTAFQWAAQHDHLDTAATIAVFAAMLPNISAVSAKQIT